jgi:hypothetical protein
MVALPNFNPVEGLISDVAGALTSFGQLRQIVANQALQSGLTPTVAATVCGAAVWTNTGVNLPTGQRFYVAALAGTAAAGSLLQLGYGTAGALVNGLHLGMSPSAGVISLGQPAGFNYGTNQRLWMYTALAGTVYAVVYTG